MYVNKRFKVSLIITVIGVLGAFVWLLLSMIELYNNQNEKFISRANNRITRAVNELNLQAIQKSTAISVDSSVSRVSIAKDGKIKTHLIHEVDLANAEYRAMYDVRDTALWKLDKLYLKLRRRMRVDEESFPIVLYLKDSLGNRIDSLKKGHISPWLLVKIEPVKLGFEGKNELIIELMFPIHQFWKHSRNSVVILFVFLILLISCIIILMYNIRREKEKMIGQHLFMSTVVHNLQSPLDYMNVAYGIIYKRYGNLMQSDHQELLEGIREKQDDMGRAITRLLNLSSIFQRIQIRPREIHLRDMFDKLALLNFVDVPVDKQVQMNIHFNSEAPVISADPVYLPVVFENLIGNAIKYSREKVVIDIDCREQAKQVLIKVKDNGIGILPQGLKRIFEIYYRDSTVLDDHSKRGFGIGLSFVRSVVSAHHGKITVNSVVNKGTEFVIILPREQWKRKWIFCTRKTTGEWSTW